MEVRQILVNVVGIVSSEDERYQIEGIAKTFVINERMKYITKGMKPPEVHEKVEIQEDIVKRSTSQIKKKLSTFAVKGLN